MYPVLYSNSFFTLTSFGVLCAVSFFVFVFCLIKFSQRENRDLQFFSDHSWGILLSALVFSRLQGVVTHWAYFSDNFWQSFYAFWTGGFGVAGALIGLFLAVFYYSVFKKEAFGAWLNVLFFALMPTLFLIYIGQGLDGMGYGSPTDLPWPLGITFENVSIPYSIPIHPVQFYLAVGCLLAIIVARGAGRKFVYAGSAGYFGFLFFSAVSFICEYFRGDSSMYLFSLRAGQVFAIMLAVVLTILFLAINRR